MYEIKKEIIEDILKGSFSCHEMKVWLWYATENPGKTKPTAGELPKADDIEILSQKLGMTIDQFYKSFRILCLSNVHSWRDKYLDARLPESEEIPHQNAVFATQTHQKQGNLNDYENKKYIEILENAGIVLALGQKVELNKMVNRYPNLEDIFVRWFKYQEHFKDVNTTDRLASYLFGKRFVNLQNNIEKFKDEVIFNNVFKEHKERLDVYKNKTISYGFSDDPATDRELAMEKERADISLSFQVGKPYDSDIKFPENIKLWERKMKNFKKEGE